MTIKGASIDASAALLSTKSDYVKKKEKKRPKNNTTANSSAGAGLTDYFWQFLPSQWNTGEFSADSAETSAQDPLCFFAGGGVVTVTKKSKSREARWTHFKRFLESFRSSHSLVVVFVSTEAAAEQQREQDDQQKGDQASCCDHPHPLVRF